MNKPVCKIVGFDEFGPLLEWSAHWSIFPIGTALAAFDAQQSAPSEQPAPMPDRDAAIEVWHKHCNPFKSKVGHFPPSSVIDAMLEFAALASQPAASVALTKQQRESIVARVQRHPFLTVDQVIDEVERFHGVTAPAAKEKQP